MFDEILKHLRIFEEISKKFDEFLNFEEICTKFFKKLRIFEEFFKEISKKVSKILSFQEICEMF